MITGVLTQGQMTMAILVAAMEMEAIATTDSTAKTAARKVMEAKVLATVARMSNQTKDSL